MTAAGYVKNFRDRTLGGGAEEEVSADEGEEDV
jgi:hypothetical protein